MPGSYPYARRAPPGARGLKPTNYRSVILSILSRSARGAWIETLQIHCTQHQKRSRSARGAWIETITETLLFVDYQVALRPGRVD